MDYTAMSDQQLADLRASYPKYTNACTPEQLAEVQAIYQEQIRRYKVGVSEYNRQATEATGLRHGDRVTATFPGAFMSRATYTGKVIHDKNGRLVVRLDYPDGSGRKTTPISKAWQVQP